MQAEAHWRSLLRDEFSKRIKANTHYSLRAFARDLDLSAGALSELLNGRRSLSAKKMGVLVKKLNLTPLETKEFVLSVNFEQSGLQVDEPLVHELRPSEFSLLSEWYYFAILNFLDLNACHVSIASIARRLGLKFYEVKLALNRLAKVGLIVKVGEKYRLKDTNVESPQGIHNNDVQRFHKAMLEKAKSAIETQPVEERHYEGVTFALDKAAIGAIKKDIDSFIESIMAKYSSGKKRSEVYHLELSFFRLTQKESP